MKFCALIFKNNELIRTIILGVLLLFSVQSSMACNDVKLASGQKILFNGFDTFSLRPTKYAHLLQLNIVGDCQQLSINFGDQQGDPEFTPAFSVLSGTNELYNTQSAQRNQNSLILNGPKNPLLIPLSFFMSSNTTTPPGNKNKQLMLSIKAKNSAGEQFEFEKILDVVIGISPMLSAGFSGTSVGQYSQNFDLDLGKLETGKLSRKIAFVIQSNVKYDITMISKNKGLLALESSIAGISPSFLNYALKLDEFVFDLSSGSKQIQNLPLSKKTVGNNHFLSVWPTSDPTKKRAGIYTDTIVIEIQQRS